MVLCWIALDAKAPVRRPALYLVASALCAMARSVELLIILRSFPGAGSMCMPGSFKSAGTGTFPCGAERQNISQLMLVIAVSPIVAPTLGGYLAPVWAGSIISLS